MLTSAVEKALVGMQGHKSRSITTVARLVSNAWTGHGSRLRETTRASVQALTIRSISIPLLSSAGQLGNALNIDAVRVWGKQAQAFRFHETD